MLKRNNSNWMLCLCFLLAFCSASFAQKDSSAIFERRISGGASKTWHIGPPAIIDVPRDKPRLTFSFTLKPRSAKWELPRGRDLPATRKFESWSIKKQPDGTYFLIFPRGEQYRIFFTEATDKTRVLNLIHVSGASTTKVGGVYFEKKFTINPVR